MTKTFHLMLATVVTVAMAVSVWGMRSAGLSVSVQQLLPRCAILLLLLAAAAYCRWRKMDRLVAPLRIIFWMALICQLHTFPMFVAAKQTAELCDAQLVRWDRALGLEVPTILKIVARYPYLREWLNVSYDSLNLFLGCALLVTTLGYRLRAAQEYVVGLTISALISFPIFSCVQAIGPWQHYGFASTPSQANFVQTFQALKLSDHFAIDLSYAEGLICFPSFHAILALLAAVALWEVRWARWLAVVWAGMIVVATITTGWHYVVDVVAAFGITTISVVGARAYSAWEARVEPERAFAIPAWFPALRMPAKKAAAHPSRKG